MLVAVLVNGFGEETGWRGYLVEQLLPRHGLVRTSLVVGVVWAGWHLPMFFLVDSFARMGPTVIGWFFGVLAGSVVLTWVYVTSAHSILLVALWHAAYNLTSATPGAQGLPAALTSTAVVVAGVTIVARSRAGRLRTPPA